jgi:UDP-N-acetylglucosamine transferase subunit ALG13
VTGGVAPKRILVTVGTDYHPFDRLVTWADRWAGTNPSAEVVVQYGKSHAPRVAEGHAFLSPNELHRQMDAADYVVTHGGPATITESRRRRCTPICVPRDPTLGEHVDDHQQRFAQFLSKQGLVRLARTEDEFVNALSDEGLLAADPTSDAKGDDRPAGVRQIGEIVAQLITEHRSR